MVSRQLKAATRKSFWAAAVFGMALIGLVTISTHGAALAQDDGGHDDGGHDEGGHDEGGGKGGGKGKGGQHGKPAPPQDLTITPGGEGSEGATGRTARGRGSSGTYIRLELGAARGSAGDASWLPPGYPSDPQVFFDLDLDTAAMAGVGVGHDYGNGWRAEVAVNLFGKTDVEGPWSFTVPDTPGPHADVEGSSGRSRSWRTAIATLTRAEP
ncbi:MAG: hypothetical protein HC844_04145 [Tabrizicola sp.]|nr:hypothetical protein [Tabrizicola sp.]